ncbi:hypothetical protein E2C01_085073 [Portunus trituberculatus]|uniref:Uncharacterized protein n=1 Tax=Portunus trituberculatus TaxID=210409 RepID=A0A5B7J5Q6_PORTR|nr:hypothetical protein [Portunus trituberculatus]
MLALQSFLPAVLISLTPSILRGIFTLRFGSPTKSDISW